VHPGLFLLSKDAATPIGASPRQAVANLPDLRSALEAELTDQSSAGRVPRAILGRYLPHLFYFGEDWLKSNMGTLFPTTDESLRRATWLSYLSHSGQPIAELTPQLLPYYADEITLLTDVKIHRENRHFQEDSLTYHLIILHLRGVLPDDLLEQFWHCADTRMRQHAMWFLGQQLQSPLLPSGMRPRGLSYFERRLAAAEQSAEPDSYREELGAIGRWCIEGQIDELWLSGQLIRMLKAGFAPTNAFQVVDWLQALSSRHVDTAVEVLTLLLLDPRVDVWAYMGENAALRGVLREGLTKGADRSVKKAQEVISFLASKGETGYLDLA
jgi:hypothetical protein